MNKAIIITRQSSLFVISQEEADSMNPFFPFHFLYLSYKRSPQEIILRIMNTLKRQNLCSCRVLLHPINFLFNLAKNITFKMRNPNDAA